MTHMDASGIAGSLSIVCWLIVFIPQLWENYQRQSGDGLSMTFLIIWLAGDVFNLAGVILQHLLPTMFWLALWYTVADMGLIWQVIYYRKAVPADERDILNPLLPTSLPTKRQRAADLRSNILALSSIVLVTLLSCYAFYGAPERDDGRQHIDWLPQVMGWTSAVLYIGSRIPQILKNWRSKSTEGLSMGMFLCAVMGNALFTASIFLRSVDPDYILINLSWILGSCGTLVFDFAIFIQFFMYRQPTKNAADYANIDHPHC